jgi:hypothetical protein
MYATLALVSLMVNGTSALQLPIAFRLLMWFTDTQVKIGLPSPLWGSSQSH